MPVGVWVGNNGDECEVMIDLPTKDEVSSMVKASIVEIVRDEFESIVDATFKRNFGKDTKKAFHKKMKGNRRGK